MGKKGRPSSLLQVLGFAGSFLSNPRRFEFIAVKVPDLLFNPESVGEFENHCHVPVSIT
jgi:hypothetical protein